MAEIQVILTAPLTVDDELIATVVEAMDRDYEEREFLGGSTTETQAAAAITAVFAATWRFDTLVAATQQMLDTWYPAAVFDGSSGEPGPRLVAALRDVLAVQRIADGSV